MDPSRDWYSISEYLGSTIHVEFIYVLLRPVRPQIGRPEIIETQTY